MRRLRETACDESKEEREGSDRRGAPDNPEDRQPNGLFVAV
jgi:hypothetical protein